MSPTEERTQEASLTHEVAWRPLASFGRGGEILYPDELLSLLGNREGPA